MVEITQILKKSNLFYKKAINENVVENIRFRLNKFLNNNYSVENINNWLKKNESKFPDSIENIFSNRIIPNQYFIKTQYKNNNAVISKIRLDDEDFKFKVKYSSILENEDNIPVLYFYILGNMDFQYDEEKQAPYQVLKEDSSLMFYDFILKGLKQIANNNKAYFSDQQVNNFIKDNKSKIDQVIRSFKTKPQFLGFGYDGVTFSIGPDLIFKMFSNTFAYNAAKKAMERLHTSPEIGRTESMMYDVGVLGVMKGAMANNISSDLPIYYYIQEKLETIIPESTDKNWIILNYLIKTIRSETVYAVNQITDIWTKHENLLQAMSKDQKQNYFNELIEEHVRNILNKIIEQDNVSMYHLFDDEKLQPNWLEKLIEEILIKTLTKRTDLHIGNIGITNQGYFRYFDPAYVSYTNSYDHLSP
jgi:hypothetical protein